MRSRGRDNGPLPTELDPGAVVRMFDTRLHTSHAPTASAMGPGGLPSELFSFAEEEMSRLYDPITVVATSGADVPIQDQCGDVAILVKSVLKDVQALPNQREIIYL